MRTRTRTRNESQNQKGVLCLLQVRCIVAKSKMWTEAELKARVWNAACVYDGIDPATATTAVFSEGNPFAHAFALNVYGGREYPRIFVRQTLDRIMRLTPGSRIWFIATDGTARMLKVNGAVKRWKREPERFALPCKYGMYEYHTFTNADMIRLIAELGPQTRRMQKAYAAEVEASLPPGESTETDV